MTKSEQSEYYKEWRKKNKEKIKEYKKQYRKNNSEKLKEYRKNNSEKLKEYHKQFHEQNKEKRNEYTKQYRNQNTEKLKEYNKEYKRNYYQRNKENINENRKDYINQRRKTDPVFRTHRILRCAVNHFFTSISKKKNDRTHNLIGCNTKKFIEFVGEKPVGDYHLDHIIPMSLFNITDPKYFKVVCSYCNFQWLSAEDNLKKSNNLSQEDYNKFVDNCMRENQHEILELFYEMNIQPINIGVKKI